MVTALIELVLAVGFFYWLFNGRFAVCATKMIDVISARVHEVYTGFRQRSSWDDDAGRTDSRSRPSEQMLRNFAYQNKKKHILDREQGRMMKKESLYRMKETAINHIPAVAMRSSFVGLSCEKCTPDSRNTLINKVDRTSNTINLLTLGKKYAQDKGVLVRATCDFRQAFGVKKYEYMQCAPMVMSDERLKQALQQITQETLEKQKVESDKNGGTIQEEQQPLTLPDSQSIYKATEKRAKSILMTMRSTISDLLLKMTSWTLYKLLPYFVSSIITSPSQVEILKRASESGLPLIFMPLHRSHLDYILVSFILVNHNIRSPLVAAGDNLKIPFFGWLLRGLGAFYIKRRLETNGGDKDILYRATLHTYMMHCLRARHNIEFFIEGARSRTGKPQLPKGGILSVILDAYLDGTIEDALLIPMSMNYEKLVDGNFVREQLGQPKEMETFKAATKAIWKVLNSHYGSIKVDFNQPFSLRELVRSFNQLPNNKSPIYKNPMLNVMSDESDVSIQRLSYERTLTSNPSCASLYGTDCVAEDQKGLVEAIGRHVVFDCIRATSIMSTNAVAFLLLTQFRDGCTIEQLAVALEALTTDLLNSDKDVGYTGEALDVASHAIYVLGPGLVMKEYECDSILVKPVTMLPNVIELSYYGNCLHPHYVIKSIVATTMKMLTKDKPSGYATMYWKDIVDISLQLCEVMSQEFILCKPCQTLEDAIGNTINEFVHSDMISVKSNPMNSYDFDDDPQETKGSVLYKLNEDESSVKKRQNLESVLRPLIDAYSVTIRCLPKLLGANGKVERVAEPVYVQEVLGEMKEMLENGDCNGESLSTDAIKNCLRLLRMWNVIESNLINKVRWLSITRQYRNIHKLNKLSDLVARFRTGTSCGESNSRNIF